MNRKYEKGKVVHRSFTLNGDVVGEALRVVPMELSGNLNRIVNMALSEFVEKLKKEKLEEELAIMAADLQLQRESARVSSDFKRLESDGL